jgi:hypothetical protein
VRGCDGLERCQRALPHARRAHGAAKSESRHAAPRRRREGAKERRTSPTRFLNTSGLPQRMCSCGDLIASRT